MNEVFKWFGEDPFSESISLKEVGEIEGMPATLQGMPSGSSENYSRHYSDLVITNKRLCRELAHATRAAENYKYQLNVYMVLTGVMTALFTIVCICWGLS